LQQKSYQKVKYFYSGVKKHQLKKLSAISTRDNRYVNLYPYKGRGRETPPCFQLKEYVRFSCLNHDNLILFPKMSVKIRKERFNFRIIGDIFLIKTGNKHDDNHKIAGEWAFKMQLSEKEKMRAVWEMLQMHKFSFEKRQTSKLFE